MSLTEDIGWARGFGGDKVPEDVFGFPVLLGGGGTFGIGCMAGVTVDVGGGGLSKPTGPGGGGGTFEAVVLEVPGKTAGLGSSSVGLSAHLDELVLM